MFTHKRLFFLFIFIVSLPIPTQALGTFKLLTTLYNEKNEQRCLEYITCIEKNLNHPLIDTIHIIYDTSQDNPQNNILLNYIKSKKITISYISERASYGNLFDIANKNYPNCKIIVSNADMFFNETLALLETYNLHNKFLALTRWDVGTDGTLIEHCPSGGSQDTWIFQTPLPKFENDTIKIGLPGCEHAIHYQAQQSGLSVINPSLSIKCCHLHLSSIRNYSEIRPYAKMGMLIFIDKCTL